VLLYKKVGVYNAAFRKEGRERRDYSTWKERERERESERDFEMRKGKRDREEREGVANTRDRKAGMVFPSVWKVSLNWSAVLKQSAIKYIRVGL
jgi:hypothetical protein